MRIMNFALLVYVLFGTGSASGQHNPDLTLNHALGNFSVKPAPVIPTSNELVECGQYAAVSENSSGHETIWFMILGEFSIFGQRLLYLLYPTVYESIRTFAQAAGPPVARVSSDGKFVEITMTLEHLVLAICLPFPEGGLR